MTGLSSSIATLRCSSLTPWREREAFQHRATLLAEPAIASVRKGDIVQLLRLGYRICDAPFGEKSAFTGRPLPAEFIVIPDGGVKSSASAMSTAASVSCFFCNESYTTFSSMGFSRVAF